MAIDTPLSRAARKINPEEWPSRMLQRFESPASEKGTKISDEEARQLYVLYQEWRKNNSARLRLLPENYVLGELKALKKIEASSRQIENHNILNPVFASAFSNTLVVTSIASILIAVGGFYYVDQKSFETRQEKLDHAVRKINELEIKKARGEIDTAAFEREIRAILTNLPR